MGWSASLRRGIDDAAAYRSGLDLRVDGARDGAVHQPVGRAGRPLRDASATTSRPCPSTATPAHRSPAAGSRSSGSPPDRSRRCPAGAPTSHRTPVAELADRPGRAGPRRVAGASAAIACPAGRTDAATALPVQRRAAAARRDRGDRWRRQHASVALGTIRDGMTTRQRALARQRGRWSAHHPDLPQRPARRRPGHQHELSGRPSRSRASTAWSTTTPIDLEIFTVSTGHASARPRRPTAWSCRPSSARTSPPTPTPDGSLDLHVGTAGSIPLAGRRDGRPVADRHGRRPALRHRAARSVPRRARVRRCPGPGGRPRCGSRSRRPGPARRGPRGARRGRRSASPTVTARADLVAARAGDPLSQAHRLGAGRRGPRRPDPVGRRPDPRRRHRPARRARRARRPRGAGRPPVVAALARPGADRWLAIGGGDRRARSSGVTPDRPRRPAPWPSTADGQPPIPPLVVVLPLAPDRSSSSARSSPLVLGVVALAGPPDLRPRDARGTARSARASRDTGAALAAGAGSASMADAIAAVGPHPHPPVAGRPGRRAARPRPAASRPARSRRSSARRAPASPPSCGWSPASTARRPGVSPVLGRDLATAPSTRSSTPTGATASASSSSTTAGPCRRT